MGATVACALWAREVSQPSGQLRNSLADAGPDNLPATGLFEHSLSFKLLPKPVA
jgi:hypothetical protein